MTFNAMMEKQPYDIQCHKGENSHMTFNSIGGKQPYDIECHEASRRYLHYQ